MGAHDGEDDHVEKGDLMYQESKLFSGEWFLCNVYVHEKRATVTFEVYGLDSQDTLSIFYSNADFDALFRFNAELMNPNRKEGRYHWVIARLEVILVGNSNKLQVAPKPTEEVAQVPQFETNRKIPTGRMDLKERQRLREQMDMLEIRRAENIHAKRQAHKEAFLARLFLMKQEDERRQAEQKQKIKEETERRFELQAQWEKEEAERERLLLERKEQRRQAVDVKEQRTEEQDEEEYRQLRQRWREKDAAEAKAYKEKKAARKVELAERAAAEQEAMLESRRIQAKRESVWKARDIRVAEKHRQVIRRLLEAKVQIRRKKQASDGRNAEFVKSVIAERQLVWEGQLQRSRDREVAFEEEQKAIAQWHENRALPKKVKTKGRFSAAEMARKEALEKATLGATGMTSPSSPLGDTNRTLSNDLAEASFDEAGEETEGGGATATEGEEAAAPEKAKKTPKKKGGKKRASVAKGKAADLETPEPDAAQSVLDEVDKKMRADLEMKERRAIIAQQREVKAEERRKAREEKEAEHMRQYRAQIREKEAETERRAAEHRIIMQQKDMDKRVAEERQREDKARLNRLRENNVKAYEARRLAKMQQSQEDAAES